MATNKSACRLDFNSGIHYIPPQKAVKNVSTGHIISKLSGYGTPCPKGLDCKQDF